MPTVGLCRHLSMASVTDELMRKLADVRARRDAQVASSAVLFGLVATMQRDFEVSNWHS